MHGQVRVPEELLQQVNGQHHLCRKGWLSGLARWRMRCDQSQHLSPWNHQIHLVQKLRLYVRMETSSNPYGRQRLNVLWKSFMKSASIASL